MEGREWRLDGSGMPLDNDIIILQRMRCVVSYKEATGSASDTSRQTGLLTNGREMDRAIFGQRRRKEQQEKKKELLKKP
jgi:hypothetical protein